MNIRIEGLDRKIKRIADFPENIRKESRNFISKQALKIEREAKLQAPVDKGLLRQSIMPTEKGDFRAVVEPVMSYAKFVHWGTGSQKSTKLSGDTGYTPGRVRAGEVARGTGGIRPNMFMARARKNVERDIKSEVPRIVKKIKELI